MELYLPLVLHERVIEVLLHEACLLEELEVKIIYLEPERQVKLTSFLVRALQAFSGLIGDHLV